MKRRVFEAFGSLFIIICGIQVVIACSCAGGANPCSFYNADGGTAFIGTVTDVVNSNEKYGKPIKGKARKITIKVDEIFKGTLPSEIETSDDGYRCDNYPFMLGKTYLIYAGGVLDGTENIVPVGLCSGTAPVERAVESIKFLRTLKAGKKPSILYGNVYKAVENKNKPLVGLPNTKVTLTKIHSIKDGQYKKPKKKERFTHTYTNKDGYYEFRDIKPGRYKLNADLPVDLWSPETKEFGGGGMPFCQSRSLYAYIDGSISGTMVSSGGIPAGFQKVGLERVGNPFPYFLSEIRTDKEGKFTFKGLSPGEYRLYVYLHHYRLDDTKPGLFNTQYPYSFWYYSNAFKRETAETVKVGFTEKIQNITLKMPPFPVKKKITGKVVWDDGTIPKKATINIRFKTTDRNYRRYTYTEPDGTFSYEIYEGFEYDISANSNNPKRRGNSEWLAIDDKEPIKLLLKPIEE